METIITHKQYRDATVRQVAREYGMSIVEVAATVGDYWQEYADEVINAIDTGAWPTYRVWKTWPESFRNDLARNYTVRTVDATAARYTEYTLRDRGQ